MPRLKGMKGAGFLVFFALFWTAIVGLFDGLMVTSAWRQAQAVSYPTVEGEITRSGVTTHHDSDGGTTYGADIEYTFRLHGVAYTSDRYRFGQMSSSDRSMAADVVSAHPVGSTVAVFYDPDDPADAILRPGIEGRDLMLALFLTPFNVVMVGLWFWLGSAVWRRITNPPAGGVPIVRRGARVFVRLPRVSPLAAAALTALGVSFVSIFAVGFGFGFNPSIPVVGTVWTVVLAAASGVYYWRKFIVGTGAKDLIIDVDTALLSLPQTFGRATDVLVPFEAVTGLEVERIVHHGSKGGTSYSYAPTLTWRDESDVVERGKLADWFDEDRANAFTGWLREQL
jgi:hypothetical protein